MTKRNLAIIAAARDWIGTPYVNQGRLKGVGVDCINLIVGVGEDAGLIPTPVDIGAYDQFMSAADAKRMLRGRLRILKRKEPKPGDVLIFAIGGENHAHFAIYDGEKMIHASNHSGRVVSNSLDDRWLGKIVNCCRFRRLDHG